MIHYNRSRRMMLLAVLMAGASLFQIRAASAQYGYGGCGGYGGYGGWGGGGMMGMGMTLGDQETYKAMAFQEGMARYNLMNAQTEQSYNYSYLLQQQAYNQELQNMKIVQEMEQNKYNLYTQAKNNAIKAAHDAASSVPLSSLIDSSGQVRWPEAAPSGGVHGERRKAADAAIQTQYVDYVKNGRSSTIQSNDARQALYAYGQPALDLLRVRRDTRGHAQLLEFLNSIDAHLQNMAAPPLTKEEKAKGTDQKPATTSGSTKSQ